MPDCTPIDAADTQLPANPCFRAIVARPGEVQLRWRVVNAVNDVSIFDELGPVYTDPGKQPARCEQDINGACSTSVLIHAAGLYRWRLVAGHESGRDIHAIADVEVQPLHPPRDVSEGGPVDALSPGTREITWLADDRNAPLDAERRDAWIEVRRRGKLLDRFRAPRLARSGPEASYQVSPQDLEDMANRNFRVRDCLRSKGNHHFCSGDMNVGFVLTGDRFLAGSPVYAIPGENLTLAFTRHAGDFRLLSSNSLVSTGEVPTTSDRYIIDGKRLTPGSHRIAVASCSFGQSTCTEPHAIEIRVGTAVDWDLERHYQQDFVAGEARDNAGTGMPLDVTWDDRGGVWLINEFSNRLDYFPAGGGSRSFSVPLARVAGEDGQHTLSKPFAAAFAPVDIGAAPYSTLMERVYWHDGKAWFTQGGGMLRDGKLPANNHSRVVSFDPGKRDLATTPHDDRFCAYNLPPGPGTDWVNTQVIGLTSARGRIWVAESHGLFGDTPSVISAFVPDEQLCDNLLDFNDPLAITRQKFQYCKDAENPEDNGCIARYSLSGLPAGLKTAHLATDPVDDSIWFTDARGRFLGHLDVAREPNVQLHPLPSVHPELTVNSIAFGGFPWSLEVTEHAVYFSEYLSGDIVRFDKQTATFSEVSVPMAIPGQGLHTLALDRGRLWFTVTNGLEVPIDRNASAFGYIDEASWTNHVQSPGAGRRITGTLYRGFEDIPAPARFPGQHLDFTGIAVDPATGAVATATMKRGQVIIFRPRGADDAR